MNRAYDSIDPVMLTVGWCCASPASRNSMSIDDARSMVAIAEMLHRFYLSYELVEWWDGVFPYEVTEPLGEWMANNYEEIPEADDPALWQQVRKLVAEASALPSGYVQAWLNQREQAAAKT